MIAEYELDLRSSHIETYLYPRSTTTYNERRLMMNNKSFKKEDN